MRKKMSTNEWVAVMSSLVVVVIIVFFSFRTSPIVQSQSQNGAGVLQSITNSNNTNTMDFDKIINNGDSYVDVKELKIATVNEGTGEAAVVGKTVSVNYSGFLTNGTKFDSSFDRNEPFEFTLGEHAVIEGWEQGVLGMKVGETRKLVIPSTLAYGERGVGPIPANSTLIFVVQLLEIK